MKKLILILVVICALGYVNFYSESKHHALVNVGGGV